MVDHIGYVIIVSIHKSRKERGYIKVFCCSAIFGVLVSFDDESKLYRDALIECIICQETSKAENSLVQLCIA